MTKGYGVTMLKLNRVKQNWAHWLYIHHLDARFPMLPALEGNDFDKKYYQRPANEAGVDDILGAISGSPRTHIQFTPGHGATTMFRAALRRLNSQPIRRLHVAIDIAEHMKRGEEIGDILWENIHRDVFRQLVIRDWYTHLHGNKRQSFQLLFDYTGYATFSDYLDSTRARLADSVAGDREDREALLSFKYTPTILSLGTLFKILLGQLGVETVILFDVPRAIDTDGLLSLMGEIKAFDEQVRIKQDFPQAALSEVYFGTAPSLTSLRTTYHRDYYTVDVPPYNRAEVFSLLASHYGVQYGSQPAQSLITILSASYLDNVWSASKTLAEMMDDLKESLLTQLDCARDKVSFGMFQDPAPGPRK